MTTTSYRGVLLAIALIVLAGCAGGSQSGGVGTGDTAAPSSVEAPVTASAPVRADVQGPISFASGTNCKRSGSSITACVYYNSTLAGFTGPGPSATGSLTLSSIGQYEDHGRIYDNHGPPSPIGSGQPVWASYESNNAGVQAWVKYNVQEDPFRTEDVVGWSIDMPYVGDDSGGCTATAYLFCEAQYPGSKEYSADYHYHFFNSPLAIEIHNNLQGLELTKQGPATMSGMLVDPKATNQAADNAVLAFDGSGGGNGRGYFGGYRSNTNDSTFTVEYEATKAAVTGDVGATLNIQATVNKDDPTKVMPATGCSVSSPSPSTRLQCKVLVGGSNAGQSRVSVEISKN